MRASRDVPPAARAVVAVAATSLFMVLVAWATLIGPDQVFTGPGRIDRPPPTAGPTCVPLEVTTTHPDGTTEQVRPDNPRDLPLCEEGSGTATPASEQAPRGETPLWVKVLTWTFVAAVLAVILALLVFVALVLRDQRIPRRRREERQDVSFSTLEAPARLREAITEDAAQQDRVLREGDPRNAIVAAWQRFEVQGESVGVGRRPWETSSEYAIRILDLVGADQGAVNRLAGLYREARFSDHHLSEEHRTRAVEALAEIRRSLEVRA